MSVVLQTLLITLARFDTRQDLSVIIHMLLVNDLFFIQLFSGLFAIHLWFVLDAVGRDIASILGTRFVADSVCVGFGREIVLSTFLWLRRLGVQLA